MQKNSTLTLNRTLIYIIENTCVCHAIPAKTAAVKNVHQMQFKPSCYACLFLCFLLTCILAAIAGATQSWHPLWQNNWPHLEKIHNVKRRRGNGCIDINFGVKRDRLSAFWSQHTMSISLSYFDLLAVETGYLWENTGKNKRELIYYSHQFLFFLFLPHVS